jgi:hypothetical protein
MAATGLKALGGNMHWPSFFWGFVCTLVLGGVVTFVIWASKEGIEDMFN